MSMSVCLVGNPNCGKTSLFNALTGTYQKIGNWSGVTVDKKEGSYKKDKQIKIVDLPGIYDLEAFSDDESVVLTYFKENNPSVIINVLDGTNLERHLYLTTKLISLGIPIVLAINFSDELRANGILFNCKKIEDFFGVEVVEISAKKRINLDELMQKVAKARMPKINSQFNYLGQNINVRETLYKLVNSSINKKETKAQIITQKIDNIITNKYLAFPLFACVIFMVYFLSSNIGGVLSDKISVFFDKFSKSTTIAMQNAGFSDWIISLFVNAFFKGVGSVLAFTPQILILFLLMTIIEESGYATRITFILDKIFRKFGLSGKSVIPVILSCGCTVNGLLATRTIQDKNEKIMTTFLVPFMPCGAKTAVFAWFSYVFFNGSPLVATSMYFIGIFCIGFFGLILKKFLLKRNGESFFVMEMPTLRLPSIYNIFCVLWEKVKDFVYKSGTILFLVSVILWFLNNFGVNGYTTETTESFLYSFGNFIKFIFYPLGFDNWQASVSVITGFFAKEAVVETFELIGADCSLLFNDKFSVYAFMTFILLSPPCAASIATAKNELKSIKLTIIMLLFQFASAYLVSLAIILIGKIIRLPLSLIFTIIIVIIILVCCLIAVKFLFRRKKCAKCMFFKKGEKCLENLKRNTTT